MNKRKIVILIIVSILVIGIILGIPRVLTSNSSKNVDEEIQKLYEYGDRIEKMDILPNTIVARFNGEEILFHEIESYRKSINNSIESGSTESEGKNAFYQVLVNKLYIYMAKEYPDASDYNLDIESNLEKTKNEWVNGVEGRTLEEYRNSWLNVLAIEYNEIWLEEDDFITYLQNRSVEQKLSSKGMSIVFDFMLEKPELANDKVLEEKIEEYKKLKEEQKKLMNENKVDEAMKISSTNSIAEIRELYIKDLIINSNIELCVENGELSKEVPIIYIQETSIINENQNNIQENIVEQNDTQESSKEEWQDETQKILNGKSYASGIIDKIDENYIYFTKSNSKKYCISKNSFSYLNGRTAKEMNIANVKIGDYLNHDNNKIVIYKNISSEELKQELLYNLTLTDNERVRLAVNTVVIEDINIIDENTATAKIKYGDIIGDVFTDEIFETTVQFNSNTKFYSKGNNINTVNDLEIARGNMNSIILNKNSINKKSFPIVEVFESSDD